MTLTMAPAAWATSTTARDVGLDVGVAAGLEGADLDAPCPARWRRRRAPAAPRTPWSPVRWLPCGKPIVVPTATSVPARIAARAPHVRRAARRPRPRRTSRPAGSRPRRTRRPAPAGAGCGRSSWRCRARSGARSGHALRVRSDDQAVERWMVRRVHVERWSDRRAAHLAVRPEDVARDQEALLDLLVGAFEAPVLVLDDAVALVALRGTARRGRRRQSTSPRPGMRGICQPMPIENTPRSYRPSRSIIRSLAW